MTRVFLVQGTHERDEGGGGRRQSAELSVREFNVGVETPTGVMFRVNRAGAPFARMLQSEASERFAGDLETRSALMPHRGIGITYLPRGERRSIRASARTLRLFVEACPVHFKRPQTTATGTGPRVNDANFPALNPHLR